MITTNATALSDWGMYSDGPNGLPHGKSARQHHDFIPTFSLEDCGYPYSENDPNSLTWTDLDGGSESLQNYHQKSHICSENDVFTGWTKNIPTQGDSNMLSSNFDVDRRGGGLISATNISLPSSYAYGITPPERSNHDPLMAQFSFGYGPDIVDARDRGSVSVSGMSPTSLYRLMLTMSGQMLNEIDGIHSPACPRDSKSALLSTVDSSLNDSHFTYPSPISASGQTTSFYNEQCASLAAAPKPALSIRIPYGSKTIHGSRTQTHISHRTSRANDPRQSYSPFQQFGNPHSSLQGSRGQALCWSSDPYGISSQSTGCGSSPAPGTMEFIPWNHSLDTSTTASRNGLPIASSAVSAIPSQYPEDVPYTSFDSLPMCNADIAWPTSQFNPFGYKTSAPCITSPSEGGSSKYAESLISAPLSSSVDTITPLTPTSLESITARDLKDRYLIEKKEQGWTYKEIKEKGKFLEAESTLRGRYRALTKPMQERVRRPEWKPIDESLLFEAVHLFAEKQDPEDTNNAGIDPDKVPWKRVADYIRQSGGSYRFGNATTKKKWLEMTGQY